MAPYSVDLRTRVLRNSDEGMASKDVAMSMQSEVPGWIGSSSADAKRGEVTPRVQTVFRRRALTAALSTLWRAIDRLGLSFEQERCARRNSGALTSRRRRRTLRVNGRTVFRHTVSNFQDVLKALAGHSWPMALSGHIHLREQIRYGSPVTTRFYQTAAIVGPTGGPVPAISGVTLYTVTKGVVDEGEFLPLN